MIAAIIALAVMAAALFFTSGWFVAARSERRARATAEDALTACNQRNTTLEAELAAAREFQSVLSPVLVREKLTSDLANVKATGGLRALPRLIDEIADAGAFSAVTLSDDAGLPVAASTNVDLAPDGVDRLVGTASLVLMLADRANLNGEPKPLGLVLHDESNRTVAYRIFGVEGARFVLTAATRGRLLSPDALDPLVGKLETVLAHRSIDVTPLSSSSSA
ncbi:hypothetical protein AKJ09_07484 [Labilithrix luteola]|uniref:Roadblock/LAMTOR2 domain-containing protein n=1 Tax=Labilithrix luteola TaxID=1391654 RepID=A0A0K1Q4R7_9BACT|nr:hypothetical protein [Labilithrix luteola]AKV00821.1 hypothetical protein AKJ09_07484 [Labilithrix luteola]